MLKNGGSKLAGRITLIAAAVSVLCFVAAVSAPDRSVGWLATDLSIYVVMATGVAAIWWAIAYREETRKPGATPLIAAVIAIPICAILYFIGTSNENYIAATLLLACAVFWGLAAVALLVVGVVKKLAA